MSAAGYESLLWQDDYLTLMDHSLQSLVERDSLHLTDKNYLNDLEAIYYSPGKFSGKQITLTGFSYNIKKLIMKR
ncbi:hypothetical protein AB1K18_05015 [Peribacillus simplex]|uniref:TIGR03943 family putative permease subunit n=1 Tax=Peribacillus simplex TaxID=1478 RepID=UPI003B8C6455